MQQRRRNVIRALFLGAALTASTVMVVVSLNPRNYFFYRTEDRSSWTYPFAAVALALAFVVLETAFTYLVFTARRPGLFWIRALLGLVILGSWGFVLSLTVVHAPFFHLLHIVYVWLLISTVAMALLRCIVYDGGRWLLARIPKQT